MTAPVIPSGAAIVLAGGRSTRLGRDKAGELLLGRSLLQRVLDRLAGLVDEYVVVRAPGQTLPPIQAPAPLSVVEDAYPNAGPLGGLYTGLASMRAPRAVAVGCDMPLLQPALLSELLRLAPGRDAVVPLNGLPEPLCAAYAASCLPAIREKLDRGSLKMTGFYDDVDVLYVEPGVWHRFDPEGLSFLNVNRDEDLLRVRELLEAGKA